MVVYKVENPVTIPGRLMPLFCQHGKEVIGDDYNLYLVMFSNGINAGNVRFFTASVDNEIIGYCVYSVGNDLMRAHVRTADCNAIFVKPEYRGRVSIRLIKFSEQHLIAEGCKAIQVHSRPSAPALTSTYEKLGYKTSDILLRREV